MAKSKKSKILASMLAVSTMAVFYATPVMAAELYEYNNDSQWVTTKGDNGTKITELEGLEEIKVGQADGNNDGLVKITGKDGEGLVRVGDSHGQNVRLAKDGVYINTNGDDKRTGLTAGTLTLAGNALTSAQLANINSVIGADKEVNASILNLDGVAMNADTKDDTLTVGNSSLSFAKANKTITNTEAIRRVVDEEHKMSATYLEETVKAHSAFGLQVLDENGKAVATISRGGSGTFNGTVTTRDVNSNAHSVLSSAGLQLYNADRTSKVNITNTGASRFGAFDETSVRIENGQLQIRAANTAENADSSGPLLASLSEDGLTLVDDERKYFTLSATRLGTINDVITKDGAVKSKGDVTSKTADGTTYTLNTVGNNTSGITSDYNGRVTTIEGAFSVNENGYIYNANGSFQVTRDGAARFGNENDNHIRMEDGVLSVKTDQNTTVVRVSEDGFYVYKDNGTVAGSLTKNGLTADSINVGGGNFTVAHNGSVKAADEQFIIDTDGNVTATEFTAGGYNLTDIGEKTAGIRRTQSGDTNVTVIEENLKVYDDGTIVGANENFKVTADGTVISDKLNVGNGNFTVSEEGIGAFDSKFTVNTNGEVSTTGINVAEGMFTASAGGVTMANNNLSVDLNGNIKAGTYNGVKIGMNEDGDIILGNGTVIDDNFNSDNVAGITRKPLDDSAPGSGNTTYIEQNTAISADGIVVRDPENLVSTKTKYNGFYVKDKDGNNVSSLTKDKLNLAGENLAYKDSEGNINVTADTYTAGDVAGENVRVKADGIYVKDGGTIVSSLKDDGLMLTDQESGESHTLNATDIADIKGIDRSGNKTDGYTTTIEGATSFTKDGMTTNGLSVEGAYGGFHIKDVSNNGENNTMIYTTDQSGNETLYIDTQNGNLVSQGSLNVAGGRFIVDKDTGNMSVNAADGSAVFHVNGNDGTVHVGKVGGAQTVITGNSITTETLNVEKIVLGDKIVDKDTGDVIGGELEIGADGSVKIDNADTDAVEFNATKTALSANYGGTSLNMDSNGFNLNNGTGIDAESFVLNADGFAFKGSLNLGAGSDVKYTGGNYGTLAKLDATVKDIYDRTSGIYKDADGNTVVTDGTWNAESKKMEEANSSITVGKDGATFESTTNEGTTNINGGAIDADSSSIGNDVSGGSGSGSSGMTGDGTYTDSSEHSGHFVDKDSSYEFTNDANGFTGTVTDGKHTTTIENGVKGSNTTVKGDNTSASSGVGIGNDGAFISDSVTNGDISHTVNGGSITDTVTNGDMTVTEVKDENGSATTVKDANGSSTVSQDTNGQTVSTGTGTSVNTGNDFGVTDNETGKSIYMSDIGHVEDIDSEIQNSDGSKTTVVDAVNNEAEIRRNEIERVDGRINNLENRVGELEDRIDKVGAMAAAIANLRTMGYDPAAPTEVAVGIGQYRDETGAALGLFHYPNRDFMLSLSVSTAGDEVMGGIGATWKFGRKSPEKVAEIKKAQAEADARRAEEAKLAKAEEMKQAAKEAKIKAQQERHAKLAAERAAQAEAAK